MCEIPANVILAEEFAARFDGFSIGSNDLTQLVLGVDRDSAELAGLFDERDAAVKRMIGDVIRRARPAGPRSASAARRRATIRTSRPSWSSRESIRSRSTRTASPRPPGVSPRRRRAVGSRALPGQDASIRSSTS